MTDSSPVSYVLADSVATITMDDGKANVMSEPMLAALRSAFDRAEREAKVVVLTGRARIFSGGYDVSMFKRDPAEVIRTIKAGGELSYLLLSFPRPVVMACNGHAIAQGAFTLLAGDVRIGVTGDFKIGLNEVVIGLTIPHYGVELARHRLAAPWFDHATVTGTLYTPEKALGAGFFDRLVAPDDLAEAAQAEARALLAIDGKAHAATKLRARRPALQAMREGLEAEFGGAG